MARFFGVTVLGVLDAGHIGFASLLPLRSENISRGDNISIYEQLWHIAGTAMVMVKTHRDRNNTKSGSQPGPLTCSIGWISRIKACIRRIVQIELRKQKLLPAEIKPWTWLLETQECILLYSIHHVPFALFDTPWHLHKLVRYPQIEREIKPEPAPCMQVFCIGCSGFQTLGCRCFGRGG